MRKIAAAACAAAVLAAAAPAATAHPSHHYTGRGCDVRVIRDDTPNQALGGQDLVYGTVTTAVVAIDSAGVFAAVPVAVDCDLSVNGLVDRIASASGVGAVLTSSRVVYRAAPDDAVSVCEHVRVGRDAHSRCEPVYPATMAAEMPANGSITVADLGAGPITTKTFANAMWSCVPVMGSDYIGMECTPTTTGIDWVCAWVTVDATGYPSVPTTGKAGGRATCNNTGQLDTGISQAGITKTAAGPLGPVVAFRCVAYGPNGNLPVAPYSVTCAEPAAPTVR